MLISQQLESGLGIALPLLILPTLTDFIKGWDPWRHISSLAFPQVAIMVEADMHTEHTLWHLHSGTWEDTLSLPRVLY